MGVGGEKGVSLEETATWAVAVVCFLLIAISILIEKLIHFIEKWLRKKRKTSLSKAHEQLKSEIMLLGFMSLLLSVLQEFIPDICIPENIATSFQPCSNKNYDENYQDPCQPKLKVQFISIHGIDQLHRFIFALAVTHVVCCATTLGLGRLKIKRWKSWEDETRTVEYQCYNDPERFRFARETTFGQRHLHFWSKSPLLLWIMCFFTQFFKSVAKVDYLTLRHGFIKEHLPSQSQSTFNFQKYISRSLEDDFRVVVGISPVIWLSAVLFLLTNTNGWYSHFWLPSIPLIIILLVGAKFQVIITQMGKSILERGAVVRGTPVVKLGDQLFWFRRPRLLLFFIHFVLFQNAFQIAFFAWSWYEFGYPSCYHENLAEIIIRIVTSLLVQVICSYVTLPHYALVTQMGSTVKPVIFSEQVASALRSWYLMASKRLKQRKQPEGSTTPTRGSTTPGHLLRDNRKPDEIKKGRVGRDNGGEISASPGQFDIDDTMRNNRYIGEIGSITPTRRGTSPGHLSLDKRKHDEKKKGKVGRDGGEEMSGSPGQYEIDDTLRNNRTTGEIESVAEYESNQAQQEIEISSRDFSFRNKQNELNFRVP